MTIREILLKKYVQYKLSPLDREILLSLALKKSKEFILAHPEKKLSASQAKKFNSFCARRANSEPIAYITGRKEFYGLDFSVNKNVLIPRPETELLIENVLNRIQKTRYKMPDAMIDIGTGSGNIIISIAKNIPNVFQKKINFFAIDVSKESLKVAKKNAGKNKVERKINFIQSDMLEYFLKRKTKFENIFIAANLPYVSHDIYKRNYKNLKYEPKLALYSNENGLTHYTKIFRQIRSLLAIHCTLFIEISPEQKPPIYLIIKEYWPKAEISFFKDLAGKWRLVEIKIVRQFPA